MNEKLFNFFSKKVGSAIIHENEFAFCHPLRLEVDERGGLLVTCTAVDREGNFYDFCWLPWADFSDNWGNPVIKRNRKYIRVGKYERLLVKDIEEIISYLERRSIL